MDGATNMPLAADTAEVHLLAEAKGVVPDAANDFSIELSRDANVSMILLCSFGGSMERRPNVVFPGETSRAYALPFPVKSVNATAEPVREETESAMKPERGDGAMRWIAACAAVLLLVFGVVWWKRRKI